MMRNDGITDVAKSISFPAGAFFKTRSMIRNTSITGATARIKFGLAAVVRVRAAVKRTNDFAVSFLEMSFSILKYISSVQSPIHFIIR